MRNYVVKTKPSLRILQGGAQAVNIEKWYFTEDALTKRGRTKIHPPSRERTSVYIQYVVVRCDGLEPEKGRAGRREGQAERVLLRRRRTQRDQESVTGGR